MAKIVTLKDKDEEILYPQTVGSGVSLENGTSLDFFAQNINSTVGNISATFSEEDNLRISSYVFGPFKSGNAVKLSFSGTMVLSSNAIKVRYDDKTTAITACDNNSTVTFTLEADTEYIYCVVLKSNITDDGTLNIVAHYGQQLAIDNLIETASDIDNKVDKEEGKGLVDSDFADGIITTESGTYVRAMVDSDKKLLMGIKKDGTTVFPGSVELSGKKLYLQDTRDYVKVVIDAENHIISGIKYDGSTYISKFSAETLEGLRTDLGVSNHFSIPLLDAYFSTSLRYEIGGTKGDPNARYLFHLPLSDNYNVRFRFRITEDIINAGKSCIIASLNGAEVKANVIPITACQTTVEYNGQDKTVNWPATDGGIAFNRTTMDRLIHKRNIGQQAFSVQYLGEGEATIENTGEEIILTVDGVSTEYSFANYPTVSELYDAMSQNSDVALQFIAMDHRNCDELLVFPPVPLRATFYCNDDGGYGGPLEEHVDSAPFFLNYAVENRWHQVEIVRINGQTYCACDGQLSSNIEPETADNILLLGGECGVLFRDLEIYTDSPYDAEIVNGVLLSSVNPYIAILMVHGMYDGPAYTAIDHPETTQDYLSSMNIETMDYILSDLTRKGYEPVSVHQIADFYDSGIMLPKRCYTLVFDDERWNECFNLSFRSVYSKYGCKPALAMITARHSTTTHNGQTISTKEASLICHAVGWDVISHTSTHRTTYNLLPSQYQEYLRNDLFAADNIYADGSIFVYPGGQSDIYILDVLEYLGYRCAMDTSKDPDKNNLLRNRYNLHRINVSRIVSSDGTPIDYNLQFMRYFL